MGLVGFKSLKGLTGWVGVLNGYNFLFSFFVFLSYLSFNLSFLKFFISRFALYKFCICLDIIMIMCFVVILISTRSP